MNEMKKWLKDHGACTDGYSWAVENCTSMQNVWDTAKPEWLIWVSTRKGVMSNAQSRKFACWCVRQIWHLLRDERSKNAIEVSERFADGLATADELSAARDAAWNAAWDAAGAAGEAWDAARAAARAAAWDVAGEAWAAAWDAAGAAGEAWDAQAKWIRDNVTPNFKDAE